MVAKAISAARRLGFAAWVALTRLRLARLGCRLDLDAQDTPRLDGLPRVTVDVAGGGGGSLRVRLGRGCRIGRHVTLDVRAHEHGTIELGDGTVLQDRIRLQPWGGAIRIGSLGQVRDGCELKSRGELVLGSEVVVGRNVTIHCHEHIRLGDRVGLAEGVTIMDSDHVHDGSDASFLRQPVVSTPVVVEDNVYVATNVLILRGAHVGRNAMVAGGAIVTAREHPGGHVLAGAPARPVRRLAPAGDDEP